MVFGISVLVIFIISFLLALGSLLKEISKPKHLKKIHEHKNKSSAKHKLEKEKVLFER